MKNPSSYKSAAAAAANLVAAANSTAPGKYVAGVSNPGVDWATPAGSEAAQAAMASGLSAAIADGRVKAGIARAGNTKWAANAKAKGGSTYGPQLAKSAAPGGAYSAAASQNLADMQAAYTAAEQASSAAGFSGNMARQNAYIASMHAAKLAREAAGGR
jgi:hypothetical protein